MEDWIKKYVELLFPINNNEIDIDGAKKLKAEYTPDRLFKYRKVEIYNIVNFEKDQLCLSEATQLNDPFECSNRVVDSEFFIQQLRNLFSSSLKNSDLFSGEEREKLEQCSDDDFFAMLESKSEIFSKTIKPKVSLKKFTEEVIRSFCHEESQKSSKINSNNIYICSLSESNESCAMWAHYADEFRGFCIEYNFRNILWSPLWCSLQPVIYQDDIPDFSKYYQNIENFNNLISIYSSMIKGTDWQYEKEWRLTLPLGKQVNPHFIVKAPKPTAIYLGLHISEDAQEILINIAKKKNIPVFKMIPTTSSFKPNFTQII